MSDIIEKTIASLPGLITGAAGFGSDKPATVSRAFQSFVDALGAIRSKHVSSKRSADPEGANEPDPVLTGV